MYAAHLSCRADASEGGRDHSGPQILAKLVLALRDKDIVWSLLRIPGSISSAYSSRQPDPILDSGCSSDHAGLFGWQVPET